MALAILSLVRDLLRMAVFIEPDETGHAIDTGLGSFEEIVIAKQQVKQARHAFPAGIIDPVAARPPTIGVKCCAVKSADSGEDGCFAEWCPALALPDIQQAFRADTGAMRVDQVCSHTFGDLIVRPPFELVVCPLCRNSACCRPGVESLAKPLRADQFEMIVRVLHHTARMHGVTPSDRSSALKSRCWSRSLSRRAIFSPWASGSVTMETLSQ